MDGSDFLKKRDMKALNYQKLGWIWLWVGALVIFQTCKKNEVHEAERVPLSVGTYYPNSGKAGSLVTIEGEGFARKLDENTAHFSGVQGEVVAVEEGRMVVRAPEGAQSGPLIVGNGSQTQEVGLFTYQSLTITRIHPANGPAGSHIRIYGEGFSSLTEPVKVRINGKDAAVSGASDTLLVAEVPTEAGSGPVEVFVDGMHVRGQDFAFQAIRSIKPLTGGAGTKVRINGEGFESAADGNIVDFNGKRAVVLEVSSTGLLVEAPEGVETGPLAVTVNGQRATGPVFTLVPRPEITEVTPLSGPAGVEMTITGKYFSPELEENIVLVNGVAVPVTATTGQKITLTLPGGTGSGPVAVVVNDQRTEGPQFRDQNLGIVGFSPDNGQDNLEVTITGTGFDPDPGANQVTFNGMPAQVTAATENRLTVLTPANVSTGTLQVIVDGQVALAPREFRRTGVQTIATGLTSVYSMVVDESGVVYAISGQRVVKITPDGQVSTLAGDVTASGNVNGTGTEARFNFTYISSIVMDSQGNLYVSEPTGHQIRKITPQGVVSTFAQITSPNKMVMTSGGDIIVSANRNPWRITRQGQTTQLHNSNYLSVTNIGIAVDENSRIYFFDASYQYDRPNLGFINFATGETMRFFWIGGGPYGVLVGVGDQVYLSSQPTFVADGNGHLLINDAFNQRIMIRRVDISTREVTAWLDFPLGFQDGPLYQAAVRHFYPGTMALAPNGDIYFYQSADQAIRKIFLR